MIKKIPHNSSFRDPNGQVFSENGEIYRKINSSYFENYSHLINSGLYKKLTELNLIIPHIEIKNESTHNLTVGVSSLDRTSSATGKPTTLQSGFFRDKDRNFKIIKPQKIPFISYPYEWCFSEYKDAALTTLLIQKIAMQYGMTLKDASAYNIQFFNGRPVLIDTLSFEIYNENKPWVAYQQFCKHFLSPLLLMKFKDINLNKLMCVFLDGIPLQTTSKLLPISTWLKFSFLSHIHLHSIAQNKILDNKFHHTDLSKNGLVGLIDNLYSTIKNLSLKNPNSNWSNYYNDNNYSQDAFHHKKQLVYRLLKKARPKIVWDFGANTGEFSFIAESLGSQTISIDNDHQSVENTYLKCKKMSIIKYLPLCIDLANPSPQIGWANLERQSLTQRGPADTILALALIHHLAIGNNIPFEKIASYLRKVGKSLIIEFIPKEDSQTQRLLKKRDSIFYDYNLESFKKKFSRCFKIIKEIPINSSKRSILFRNP